MATVMKVLIELFPYKSVRMHFAEITSLYVTYFISL